MKVYGISSGAVLFSSVFSTGTAPLVIWGNTWPPRHHTTHAIEGPKKKKRKNPYKWFRFIIWHGKRGSLYVLKIAALSCLLRKDLLYKSGWKKKKCVCAKIQPLNCSACIFIFIYIFYNKLVWEISKCSFQNKGIKLSQNAMRFISFYNDGHFCASLGVKYI